MDQKLYTAKRNNKATMHALRPYLLSAESAVQHHHGGLAESAGHMVRPHAERGRPHVYATGAGAGAGAGAGTRAVCNHTFKTNAYHLVFAAFSVAPVAQHFTVFDTLFAFIPTTPATASTEITIAIALFDLCATDTDTGIPIAEQPLQSTAYGRQQAAAAATIRLFHVI